MLCFINPVWRLRLLAAATQLPGDQVWAEYWIPQICESSCCQIINLSDSYVLSAEECANDGRALPLISRISQRKVDAPLPHLCVLIVDCK